MPKPKLPAHLPQAWKYGNRFLEPGLTPALRRLYKDKIVLPEPEPLWSKSIKYGTYLAGGGPQPGRPQRLTLVFFGYVYFIMDHGPVGYSALITRYQETVDNWYAQFYFRHSKQREALDEARLKQDEWITEQEKQLEQRVALRKKRESGIRSSE